MNAHRRNLYLQIERTREIKLRAQRICILLVLAGILVFMFSACSTAYRSVIRPDGTQEKELYAKLGGKGAYDSTSGTGMKVETNDEASMKAVVGGAVSYGLGVVAGEVWKARDATKAATEQLSINSKAAVETSRITATQQTATTLGANPEANPATIKAAGELFKAP